MLYTDFSLFAKNITPTSSILSIDYGTKNIGLAYGTPILGFAINKLVVPVNFLDQHLVKIITEKAIVAIIIGLPKNPKGIPTFLWKAIENLIENININFSFLNILAIDERFSTAYASKINRINLISRNKDIFYKKNKNSKKKINNIKHHINQNKINIDAISASFILEIFFDYYNQNGGQSGI